MPTPTSQRVLDDPELGAVYTVCRSSNAGGASEAAVGQFAVGHREFRWYEDLSDTYNEIP